MWWRDRSAVGAGLAVALAVFVAPGCTAGSPATVTPVPVPGSSAVARASSPPAPPPLEAAPIAGAYAADFSVSVESSCSQSWDVTTWSGDASLQVQPDGSASLELGFDSRSVGGSWQGKGGGMGDTSVYEWDRETCRWEGKALEEGGQTRITMSRVSSGSSMCDPGYVADPNHPRPDVELVCNRGLQVLPGVPPGTVVVENPMPLETEVLTCTPGEQLPHMVRYLVDPDANVLVLGATRTVRIDADEMGFGGTMYSLVVIDPAAADASP